LSRQTAAPDLVTKVDRVRRIRNELVRAERFDVSRDEAWSVVTSVRELVSFLQRVASNTGMPLERHV
jgi:hypothetical protein